MSKGKWLIRIAGYGTFEFEGTEQEAEDMRKNKAKWEGGRGLKWRIGEWRVESDIITACVADFFDAGFGAPGSLINLRRKFLKAEAKKEVENV